MFTWLKKDLVKNASYDNLSYSNFIISVYFNKLQVRNRHFS
jgi:hypothetical protein